MEDPIPSGRGWSEGRRWAPEGDKAPSTTVLLTMKVLKPMLAAVAHPSERAEAKAERRRIWEVQTGFAQARGCGAA